MMLTPCQSYSIYNKSFVSESCKNLTNNEVIAFLELRFGGYKLLPIIYYNNKIQENGSLLVTNQK